MHEDIVRLLLQLRKLLQYEDYEFTSFCKRLRLVVEKYSESHVISA